MAAKRNATEKRRCTFAEFNRRVLAVYDLRLGGAEFEDLRKYAAAPEQSWGVSESQLWRYVRAADALMKQHFDAQAEHLLARHLLQRRQLYAHCMSAGDFRTALAVLKDEAELETLYPARKLALTDPTGEKEFSGGLTDADRALALERLYARLGQGSGAAAAVRSPQSGGPILGRPGPADGGGRDAAGPLAGGPAARPLPEDAAPLFPTGR